MTRLHFITPGRQIGGRVRMTLLHFHLLPLKRDTLDKSLPVCILTNRDSAGQARRLNDGERAGSRKLLRLKGISGETMTETHAEDLSVAGISMESSIV